MVQPSVRPTPIPQRSNQSLRNNRASLTSSSADTVPGRTVPSGEDFARDDESGTVGSEILEEVAEAIKRKQSASRDFMETESDNREKDGQNDERAHLNWFSSDCVDRCDSDPVTRDKTSG